MEAELVELEPADKLEFLESLGVSLENCGLRALVREAYDLLELAKAPPTRCSRLLITLRSILVLLSPMPFFVAIVHLRQQVTHQGPFHGLFGVRVDLRWRPLSRSCPQHLHQRGLKIGLSLYQRGLKIAMTFGCNP